MTDTELNDFAMLPGKTYEITYNIPISELEDKTALRVSIAGYIENIIKSPDLRYVSSIIDGDKFRLRVTLRDTSAAGMSGLGLLPVFGYVAAFAVVSLIAVLGLKWSVNSVKEISTPVTDIAKSLTPLLAIAAAIYLMPPILALIPKRRK